MKNVSTLSSVVAIASFGLSLLFAQYSVGLYAVAFSASLLLIAACDYSPRTRKWEPQSLRHGATTNRRPAQRLQLAA